MSQSKRHTLEEEVTYLRTEFRRAKRGARWLGESRDYWRERARAAEWALNAVRRSKRGNTAP